MSYISPLIWRKSSTYHPSMSSVFSITLKRQHLILFTNNLNSSLKSLLFSSSVLLLAMWNVQIEMNQEEAFHHLSSPASSPSMSRDEKYVLNRLEKPLKPLVRSFLSPTPPTCSAMFLSISSCGWLHLNLLSRFPSFFFPFPSHHPENVDKSPACFKSLSNQHKIIQLLLRLFLPFFCASLRASKAGQRISF